jgi:hypothetical protein
MRVESWAQATLWYDHGVQDTSARQLVECLLSEFFACCPGTRRVLNRMTHIGAPRASKPLTMEFHNSS